ncbi:MAG: threonine transporter RhtB [Planctomycetota bacterium]|nr:MAG: threonine transporter RhtB [Planctomycetota bacterium]
MQNEILLSFLITIAIVTITPGIDTLLVIRNTNRGGIKDGSMSNLGICSGLFIHALISSLGLSLIFIQTAWLFGLIKILGALYLIWLGTNSIFSVFKKPKTNFNLESENEIRVSKFKSFYEGLVSNVLNPKVLIFYMAFFPQFINFNESVVIQSLLLAGIHFTIALIWQSIIIILLNNIKDVLKSSAFNKVMNSVTGSVFIFFGLNLLLNTDKPVVSK